MKTKLLNHSCPICKSSHIGIWGAAADIGNTAVVHKIAKCKKCTHIFIYPLPSKEFLAEAYNTCSKSVLSNDSFYVSRSNGTFSKGDLWVLEHVKKSGKRGNLIDIGSANTRLISMIIEFGWKVTIIEPSRNIEQMSFLNNSQLCRGLFEDCVVDNKFEIVSAIDVLEHTHSPINFLKKIKSVLSISGIVLMRFPNSYSLKCKLEHDKWNMIRPLGHLHFFSPHSFAAACQICELKIHKIRSHDLDNYLSLSIRGKALRGMRFLSPLRSFLHKMLLGDQLLVSVSHE